MLKMLKKIDLNILKFQPVENPNSFSNGGSFTYNYLLGLVMLYMTLAVLSGLNVHKLVLIGPFLLPAGIFTAPFTYCLSNVITEVYGFPVARNMMWWFVICSTIFTGLSFLLIHLPSPIEFTHQDAFNLILGSMPRVYIAGIVGTIVGININNYYVSKLKIKMEGRHYWFRSLISTCGGEVIYNVIAYPIMMLWHVSLSSLLHIFISVTVFKIFTTSLFLLPECLLARYLKFKEKIDVFDYNVNYNLFNFKLHGVPYKPKLALVNNRSADE